MQHRVNAKTGTGAALIAFIPADICPFASHAHLQSRHYYSSNACEPVHSMADAQLTMTAHAGASQ